MPTTPEFFYFDLGRVLLAFDHERMIRQMAGVAGVDADTMRRALMPAGDPAEGDLQWRLESGQVDEDAYYEELAERLGCRPPREDLALAASDIFEPMEDSMRLVERLAAAGHRLGILSNTNPVHAEYFLSGRYPVLLDAFEFFLGSHQAKSMKPAPAIYQIAIERAGVPAEKIFFTDDKPENVAGAIACGIDAVLFTGAAELLRELVDRGVQC